MHELSLCLEVVAHLQDEQRRHGFAQVLTVGLRVGRWRAVEPAAMELCFGEATRGTVAEGARLLLEVVEPQAHCDDCAATVPLEEEGLLCPRCGGLSLRLLAGDELRLTEIEVK